MMRFEGLVLALFFWANYASADIADWFKPSTVDLKTVSTDLYVDTTISQLCKYASNVATLREKEYSYLYTVDGETVTSEILFVPIKYRKFSISWYFKFTESPHATGFKVAANGDDIENVSGVVNLKNGEAIITYDVIFPLLSFVDSVIDYCVNEFVSWTWEVFNPATGGDEILTFYTGNLGATKEQILKQFTCSIVNFLDCPIYSAGLRYDCQGLANFQTCSQVATLTGPESSSSEVISSESSVASSEVDSSTEQSSTTLSEDVSESSTSVTETSSEDSTQSSDDTSTVLSSEVLSTSSSADISSTVSSTTTSTATDAYITGYYLDGQPHWDLHIPGSIGTWTSIEITGTNGGSAYRFVSGEFLVDGKAAGGSVILTDASYDALYEEPIDETSELIFSLSAQATGPAPYIYDAHITITTPDERRVRILKRAVIDYDFSNTLVSDASYTTNSDISSDTISDSATPTSEESSTLSTSVSSESSSVLSSDSSLTSEDVTSSGDSSVAGESTASGSDDDLSSSSSVTDGVSITSAVTSTSDDTFTTTDIDSTSSSDSSAFSEGLSTGGSSDDTITDTSNTATGEYSDDEDTATFTGDDNLTVFTDAFGNIVTGSITTVTTTNSVGSTVTLTTTYCPATESQVYTGVVTTVIEGEVLETPLVTSYEYITIYDAGGEVETIITTYVTKRITVDNPTTSVDAVGTFVTTAAEVSSPEAEAEADTASISDVIGTGIPAPQPTPAGDSEETTTISTTLVVPVITIPTYSEFTSVPTPTAAVVSSFEGAASKIQVQGFFLAIFSVIMAVLF